MEPMQFNVLRRAQDNTKVNNKLNIFFREHGIEVSQVKNNPECYRDLIMKYSKQCINQELFQESKEIMEKEFSRLCEFHRRNEEELVEKFYSIATNIIKEDENI